LSQPHTGIYSRVQACDFLVQVPPLSVAPHWERYAQYRPSEQSPCTPRVPQSLPSAMPVPLSPAHAPALATDTPLRPATQVVAYVLPSQPHTGANSMVHKSGIGLQLPAMSPAPHLAESGYEQNCFSGHWKPAMPPHILPAGAATDPALASAIPEDGAGDGNGAELTTPVGVSAGIWLALGVTGALIIAVAVGAWAPAGGLGCAEQLTNAVADRNSTHTSTRFALPMQQH